MESNEKQIKYANILDIIDGMKQDVVNTSMQQLLMTGAMPEIAQNELKVLSQITGAIFNGIISIGTEVYEDENNSGLVYTKINGKKYSCARINISNSVSITSKPLSASEAYSMTTSSVENVAEDAKQENAKKVSIEEFEDKEKYSSIEEPLQPKSEPVIEEQSFNKDENSFSKEVEKEVPIEEPTYSNEEPIYNNEPDYNFAPSKLDEASEFGEEEPYNYNQTEENNYESYNDNVENQTSPQFEEKQMVDNGLQDDDDFEVVQPKIQKEEPSIDDLLDDDDFGDVQPAPIVKDVPIPIVETPTPVVEPAIITKPERTEVKTFTRNDMWEEEFSKDVNTMIYNMSKLTVAHIGGGKPEEIIVMIAPLKISRVSAPAVPIIVTLYNRGKVVTKSSYDMGDGGKAIVTLDINEFYFLCRGSFDEEGKFKAFITTTGPSSQQGDRINVVSSKNYGNSHDPETKNGHIKMKYNSESGDGTIEVFPFGTSDDCEFVIMVKNPEFCDTYYINQNGRTGTSAIIYGADCKLEIVPNWNGDILEVEMFEK